MKLGDALVLAKTKVESVDQVRNLNLWGNGLTDVEDIRGFAVDGYRFNADESSARDWVFTRDVAPAPAGGGG